MKIENLNKIILKNFDKKFVVKRPNSENRVLGKFFRDSILCWEPENIEQFLLEAIKEGFEEGLNNPREIKINTNHLKTLMLGIKIGRIIGVGLSINDLSIIKENQK